jgi:hypothetical protein
MTFIPFARKLALAVALAALPVAAAAAPFPRLESDALGGTHVVLPDDAAGKPFVLVLAYTPESQSDVTAWARALLHDTAAHDASLYIVVVADRSAFVSRKRVRSIAQGAAVGSPEQVETHVLVTFTGEGWHDLMGPGDKHAAGIVVCDAHGSIVFSGRDAFTPAHHADVVRALP